VIRVVVDDHPIVRDGVVMNLRDAGDVRVVGSAANAAGALELVETVRAAPSGTARLAPPIAAQLLAALRGPRRMRVTEREREILRLLAEGLTAKGSRCAWASPSAPSSSTPARPLAVSAWRIERKQSRSRGYLWHEFGDVHLIA
jgi:DNA-binding NarL/FixJ family response regulator